MGPTPNGAVVRGVVSRPVDHATRGRPGAILRVEPHSITTVATAGSTPAGPEQARSPLAGARGKASTERPSSPRPIDQAARDGRGIGQEERNLAGRPRWRGDRNHPPSLRRLSPRTRLTTTKHGFAPVPTGPPRNEQGHSTER